MKTEDQILSMLQKMDAIQILEMIVQAKTGGELEGPLKARIVYQAHRSLKNMVNEIYRANGSSIVDESALLPKILVERIEAKRRKNNLKI